MLEYLVRSRDIFTPPVFFLGGLLYTFLSVILASILFPYEASITHVLLATLAVAPIMFRAILVGADTLDVNPHKVLHVQSWLISLYAAYMTGAVMGLFLGYHFVPEPMKVIERQWQELKLLEKVRLTGMVFHPHMFSTILANNLRVYLIGILLSFLYGTGGLLLLNWNASIIAALLFLRAQAKEDMLIPLVSILPHGLLEFLGYFTGGITGVLLGVALVQEGWNTRLLRDVIVLFVLGVLFIVLGAFIEALG